MAYRFLVRPDLSPQTGRSDRQPAGFAAETCGCARILPPTACRLYRRGGRVAQPHMLLSAASITKAFAGVRALKGVSFDLVLAKCTPSSVRTAREIHPHQDHHRRRDARSRRARRQRPRRAVDGSRPLPRARHRRHLPAAVALPRPDRRENIAMALETGGAWRRLDWAARQRRSAELLGRIGASIDPARLVETLSMPSNRSSRSPRPSAPTRRSSSWTSRRPADRTRS